jgi:ssDNA-binding Zn-finger/Zn-ribbon topoisomerase 1
MKKILSCVLAASMIFGMFALPASAAGEVQPRAALCDECGAGEMRRQADQYTEWVTVGFTRCSHGDPRHNDDVQERTVTVTYTCDNCGASWYYTETETQTIHA